MPLDRPVSPCDATFTRVTTIEGSSKGRRRPPQGPRADPRTVGHAEIGLRARQDHPARGYRRPL
jgi:hypothetical protein